MRSSKEIAKEIRNLNKAGRKINAYQNEGGCGYDHTPDTSALEAEYHAAKKEEFAAEWTAEVTATRRATFNDLVISKKFKTLHEIEQALGFTRDQLAEAIELNK